MNQQHQQPYVQQVAMTQRAIAQQQMGYGSLTFHWTMILCTAGLWWPVYANAKRKRRTVTVYR